MTKEQAIEVLNTYYRGEDNDDREFCSAIDMAIKALEQQPSDDCVDINHVIATISQHHFDKDKDNFDLLIHNLCKEVKALPPVTHTRKVGKWIEIWDEDHLVILAYKCSECETMRNAKTNYCADCGAEMVGSKNE